MLFRLQSSATFSVRTHTDEGAQQLAMEWCTKMQYLFDLWDAAGRSPEYDFLEPDLQAYLERPELARAIEGGSEATLVRAAAIRNMIPFRVGG